MYDNTNFSSAYKVSNAEYWFHIIQSKTGRAISLFIITNNFVYKFQISLPGRLCSGELYE